MNLMKLDAVQDTAEAFAKRGAPLPDDQEPFRALISALLTKKGLNPAQIYRPDSKLWVIPAQPAPVVLRLLREGEAEAAIDFIETMMRVAPLPAKNILPFYRYLLESNQKMNNAAFCVDGDSVFLRSSRQLEDLDEAELDDMISSLVEAAEDYFAPLLEQFAFGASILR